MRHYYTKSNSKPRLVNAFFIQFIIVFFSLINTVKAQTTHINPATNGGFESGTTFAANGWTATTSTNNATRNQWIVSTGATAGFSGTRCAYVTNINDGTPPPHSYAGSTRHTHLYRDVTVPAGETTITLSFSWISVGDGTNDKMRVLVVPTSTTINYATILTPAGTAPTGIVQVGATSYSGQATWTNTSFTLPTAYAGTSFRLVFYWDNNNDATIGNPPAAVDNISLISSPPTACVAPNQATAYSAGTKTTTSLPASFTASSGGASGYLVVQSTSATAPSPGPSNGTLYTAGTISGVGSGLTFIQSGSSTTIPGTGLAGNTQYYYYIYAYNNTSCTGGPIYATGSPLSGNGITCPDIPNTVSVSGISSSGFAVNWSAPTGGSASAITYTIQVTTDVGYNTNVAGSPFTVSAPTITQSISGLSPGTTYYYRILASNGCSSAYVSSSTATTAANPCSSAATLACGTTNLAGSTVGSTSYAYTAGCDPSNFGKWYTFVGDGNQTTITSVGTGGFDQEMTISSGTCGSLSNISCQDSSLGNGTETATFTTVNGTTYYVYVAYWFSGGVSTDTGTFTISRSCTAPFNPCTSIPNITACGIATTATIAAGTGAYNTSACGFTTSGQEQLYTFTPTTTGTYTIAQTSSFAYIDYQYKIASTGCNGTGWTCIDDMSGSVSSPNFTLTAGTQYYILLDPESTAGGTVNFSIACPPPPVTNDEPCNAIPLTVSSTCSYTTYTNAGSTGTTGVTAPGCASYTGGDVWFSAVVPLNGILIIDTNSGSMTDSGMAIYTGTCSGLTLLACDDDSSTNGAMSYLLAGGLTAGSTVFIRIWEFSNDNPGSFGICVTSPPIPTNNDCSAPTALTVNSGESCTTSTNGNTYGATQSQVACIGTGADDDIWYQFTATGARHTITVTPNTLNNAVFEVFSGSCGSLTSLACINNTTGSTAETTTLSGLTIGTVYLVRVHSNNANVGSQGTFAICVTTPCALGSGLGTTTLACINPVAGEAGQNGADPAAMNCASPGCVNLEVTYLPINQTTAYTVSSIPYAPPYQFSCLANAVSVNVDDVWSPSITLPFNFCFYGNTYTSCVIGSNGTLSFNTAYASTSSGFEYNNNLPSTASGLFGNTIYGVYHDIDPSEGGKVGYELITLDSGCRALVASWSDVPMYLNNSILYTGMMVLYENTNIIDIYIKEKNIDDYSSLYGESWNYGNGIVGIQNAAGTAAVVAPNRNGLSPNWTATSEAWRFTPSGPAAATTVKWYEGSGTSGTQLSTSSTFNVCPLSTTTYTAEVTYALCSGTVILTDETTVTINGGKVWTGNIDTDWNKAGNWNPNTAIPTSTDCVVIPNTTNKPIVSGTSYNALAGTLSVYANALLTINSNNSITVTDWVNVQANGTFIINNTASLVQVNNVANTGNIVYRRNANIRSLDYVYWSSPVAGFNVSNIASPLTFWGIYKWNTTVANSNGGQGNWESAAGNTMIAGKGYIASGPSTFSSTTAATLNGVFTGVPNNGDISLPIYRGNDTNTNYHQGTNLAEITNYSDNWNLVGNPYPSAIRASQFLYNNNTKIMGNVKLWTHGTLPAIIASPFYDTFIYNYSPGDYLTYNFTGTSCCPLAGADLFIGAGQGFFVQMIDDFAGSDIITFNNGLRSSSYSNSTFYRLSNSNTSISGDVENLERNRIWLDIIDSNNNSDRTLFGYIEEATMGNDSFFDCITQNTGGTAIYSLLDNGKFSIQGRALPFDVNDEVPIGVNIPTSGNYSIALAAIDGLFEGQNIYLKDNLLNITHNLKTNPYPFTAQNGMIHDRFKVIYLDNALGNPEFSADNNIRTIIKDNVSISSNNLTMESIMVYNVLGQKIDTYNNINTNYFTLSNLRKNNAGLVLKIKLQTGQTVIRKVIY